MNTKVLVQGISKTFMVVGGLLFFFGDRALREIWHLRFVPAELCGIGGGIVLMFLGAAIRPATLRPAETPEQPDRD